MNATRVAAYGLVVDGSRILLCRIANMPPSDGLWTLPGGGLEFGEDPATAMVREVEEETGLHVVPNEIAGVDSIVVDTEAGPMHGIRIVYRVSVVGGSLRDEVDGSTDQCRWWERDSVEDLVELADVGVRWAFDGR